MYFSKINTAYPKITLDVDALTIEHTKVAHEGTLTFFYLPSSIEAQVTSFLKEAHNFSDADFQKTRAVRIKSSGSPLPHTDCDKGVALNYYLTASGEVTVFYENPNGAQSIASKGSASIYNPLALNEASSFVAKAGETYLLDIAEIHSVNSSVPYNRIYLQTVFSKALSFEDVHSRLAKS